MFLHNLPTIFFRELLAISTTSRRKTTCRGRSCGCRPNSRPSAVRILDVCPMTLRRWSVEIACLVLHLFSLSLFAMQLSVFNISLIKIYIILICPKKHAWVASAAAKCQAPLATQVEQSIQRSLQNLGTSYIDSLVMHSPMPTLEENLEVWISSWVSMMNNDNDGFRYQISLAVQVWGVFEQVRDLSDTRGAMIPGPIWSMSCLGTLS